MKENLEDMFNVARKYPQILIISMPKWGIVLVKHPQHACYLALQCVWQTCPHPKKGHRQTWRRVAVLWARHELARRWWMMKIRLRSSFPLYILDPSQGPSAIGPACHILMKYSLVSPIVRLKSNRKSGLMLLMSGSKLFDRFPGRQQRSVHYKLEQGIAWGIQGHSRCIRKHIYSNGWLWTTCFSLWFLRHSLWTRLKCLVFEQRVLLKQHTHTVELACLWWTRQASWQSTINRSSACHYQDGLPRLLLQTYCFNTHRHIVFRYFPSPVDRWIDKHWRLSDTTYCFALLCCLGGKL